VETVLMRYHYGNTVCISTEVGCRMGCAFCASTLGGLVRRLEPFEMLDQVLFTQVDSGLPVSHIVLMGIGEPLDNFDNVIKFLELVNSPEGMNISMRHISLSTCGLVPKIDELAKRKLQLTLSVSLHAPNDEIRNRIMPVNKAYPTEELLEACRRYYQATSRRISFEYAMIDGVNDREQDARELLRRLKGLPAHFNLIPLNHVEESPLKPSSRKAVAAFQKTLEDGGVTATVRRTLGGDIDASCGQLRRKYSKEQG
jgi:23S rRNA (adenine2503-C2)-methyltransferase